SSFLAAIPSPDIFFFVPRCIAAGPCLRQLHCAAAGAGGEVHRRPAPTPSHDGAAHRCPCLKGRGAADADAGRRRHLGSYTPLAGRRRRGRAEPADRILAFREAVRRRGDPAFLPSSPVPSSQRQPMSRRRGWRGALGWRGYGSVDGGARPNRSIKLVVVRRRLGLRPSSPSCACSGSGEAAGPAAH
ncbi:unnamed protein product, partial [Urochloa humidicola]